MSYQETIEYLYGLQKQGVKLGLANSFQLMELMGRPHEKFRSVHVAGTNGKGSTAAFLAFMLREAGLRTGLYTSPHLVNFTERIRINGVPIAEDRVMNLTRRVQDGWRRLAESGRTQSLSPTFFEATTAVAFTYFAEERVDIAVVEVGMGGRMDSTNVITPLVSVITNIDLEHTEFLGNTLEQIAGEKAGIVKERVPVVTGATQPEVISVIENRAGALHAPSYRLSRDFQPENIVSGRPQSFDYRGLTAFYKSLRVHMLGGYQIDNACLALAAAECMRTSGLAISEAAVRNGLNKARWEGRLERVSEKPDIYLDGAHNPASARALARTVRQMRSGYRNLVLVIGILADKDYRAILSELAPLADSVVATRPQYSRALDVFTLASEIRGLHRPVITTDTLPDAVVAARRCSSADDIILITGSLYVVGDARATLVGDEGGAPSLKGLKG